MGLLTQALAGFGSGLGDGMARIGEKRMAADAQSERDKALALKEQNLARFKHGLDEEAAVAKQKRDLETKRGEMDTDFKVGGSYTTKQRVLDQQITNDKAAAAKQAVADRAAKAEIAAGEAEDNALLGQELAGEDKYSPKVLDAIDEARAPGKATKEESGLIHSEKKITKVSDEVLAAKQAHDTDKFRAKVEQELNELKTRGELTRANLERKAELQMMLEVFKQREISGRSSSRESDKLTPDEKRLQTLDDLEAKNGQLSERQQKQRDDLDKKLNPPQAKTDGTPKAQAVRDAKAKAKKEADDKAGVFRSDKKDFAEDGGDREKFIERRTQEILSGGSTQSTPKSTTANKPVAKPAAPPSAKSGPSMDAWLVEARKANKGTSDAELKKFYNQKYGR